MPDQQAHRLGFAVKVLSDGGLPSHDARRWQSGPHLRTSLERFEAILAFLERESISMYRLTSDFIPYGTHPDLPQFHNQLEECAEEVAAIGARVRELGLRLSSHPGQYTVLNSEREDVRIAAARDLDLQARFFDAMGLGPEAVVVLHVGAARGDTKVGADAFVREVERLSEPARRRLVIENDDRIYGLADVLEVSRRTGLRVVWDILHHHCHDPEGIPDREALELALATWPEGEVPKIHYSTPKTAMEIKKVRKGRRVEKRPGAARAARPRRHGRPDRLRALPADHRARPALRRDARGQGQGPRAAAPRRSARRPRHPQRGRRSRTASQLGRVKARRS